ncbi:hypothetical protein GCM10007978_30200 [Shewanella hanedai]|uniref:Uncharacterized protein n=2 Tax=Shewanella hanedai TaxID=25 RepID=A0A553JKI7_SHEHA|nr:hypothetical protein [Shewanella hanedai]TRY12938.1 hypothetical protein FN961_17700 [Shewanella hanedai]GGI90544.1 hypothetical protein GCM10007978_30200 [Shewanella hanedai]
MKPLPIDYENGIPDYAETHFLHKHIDDLLDLSNTGEYRDHDVCEGLWELVVRIGNNPEGIDSSRSLRIFKWLKGHWPSGNIEYLDSATAVLLNLRHSKSYIEFLQEKLTSEISSDEVAMIKDALSEFHA